MSKKLEDPGDKLKNVAAGSDDTSVIAGTAVVSNKTVDVPLDVLDEVVEPEINAVTALMAVDIIASLVD